MAVKPVDRIRTMITDLERGARSLGDDIRKRAGGVAVTSDLEKAAGELRRYLEQQSAKAAKPARARKAKAGRKPAAKKAARPAAKPAAQKAAKKASKKAAAKAMGKKPAAKKSR
jgi:ATPase subunit of ABC transporter with duplicated ATPase domains